MDRASTREGAPGRTAGYTLVELMITLAVLGSLATVAIVNYFGYVEKARVARAVAEIESISRIIDALFTEGESDLPDSLADIDADHMLDPWGHPYRYLKIAGGLPSPPALPAVGAAPGGRPTAPAPAPPTPGGSNPPVIAEARKDQFLVPINSDYDLYSMGADGLSRPSLSSLVSRDDVIRARDGAYVGLAEQF